MMRFNYNHQIIWATKSFLLLSGAFALLTSCQGKENKPSSAEKSASAKVAIASIDSEEITLQDYQQYSKQIQLAYTQLKGTPDGDKKLNKLQKDLVEQLISRQLMLKEAHRLKLKLDTAEVEQEIKKVSAEYENGGFEKIVQQEGLTLSQWRQNFEKELLAKKLISREVESKVEVSDEEINKYYKEHSSEFNRPEQVRVRQIVVESEVEATELWDKLRRGADFAKLAETRSLSPDSKRSGDLGYFSRGQMPIEFEQIAFELSNKNPISRVFSTNYGYHIFQFIDRRAAHQASLSEVMENIRKKLRQEKLEANFQSWLAGLRSTAKIKINPYFMKNT